MIDKDTARYVRLWRSVFVQASKDLYSIERSERMAASSWLFDDLNTDYRDMVCDLAGIHFEAWRREMLVAAKRIAQRNSEL